MRPLGLLLADEISPPLHRNPMVLQVGPEMKPEEAAHSNEAKEGLIRARNGVMHPQRLKPTGRARTVHSQADQRLTRPGQLRDLSPFLQGGSVISLRKLSLAERYSLLKSVPPAEPLLDGLVARALKPLLEDVAGFLKIGQARLPSPTLHTPTDQDMPQDQGEGDRLELALLPSDPVKWLFDVIIPPATGFLTIQFQAQAIQPTPIVDQTTQFTQPPYRVQRRSLDGAMAHPTQEGLEEEASPQATPPSLEAIASYTAGVQQLIEALDHLREAIANGPHKGTGQAKPEPPEPANRSPAS